MASTLADRFARDRVLIWSSALRAAATALAALALVSGGPIAATYALATLAACVFILFRAAHSALLPALSTTPLELTSATMARGLVDSISTLAGPLLAGLLLSVTSVAATFAVIAALAASSGALLVKLSFEAPPRQAPPPLRRIVAETAEGFGAIARHRDAALLICLALVQTFTRGCLLVFLVVIAFDLLGTGQVGVALLTAAVGAGAILGSTGALLLVSGRRLAVIQGVGVALWGVPLVLCGALPDAPLVVLLRLVRSLGPGECFGEIALLRDTPRTATVRARSSLHLYMLSRPDFLLAVSSYSASARGPQSLLDDRLSTFTPDPPPG